MPTTANRGYPKPAATDAFANGWDAIADLADAVDADVAAIAALPPSGSRFTPTGAPQALPTSTWTRLALGTTLDLEGGVTGSGGGLVIPSAGRYLITGQVQWEATAAGTRAVALSRNHPAGVINGNFLVSQLNGPPSADAGQQTLQQITALITLTAGDLIEMWGRQSSGVNRNVEGGGAFGAATWLSLHRLSV